MPSLPYTLGLLISSLFIATQGYGQSAPILTLDPSHTSGARIGAYVEYIQDSRPAQNFSEIERDWESLGPQTQNQSAFSLGMLGDPYWFKIRLHQPDLLPKIIYLEHDYPSASLEVFHRSPDHSLDVNSMGYNVPSRSAIPYRNQTISLRLEPGQHEIHFRLDHVGAMRFSIRLWTPEAFGIAKVQEEILVGMLLGISLLMVFYNMLTYLTLRSKLYFHYVGYLCTCTFFLAFYSGVGQELGNTVQWIFAHFWISSLCLMLFYLIQFTQIFLLLAVRMPRIDRILKGIAYLCLIGVVLEQVHPVSAFILIQILANPTLFLFLVIASMSALRGYRPARFYLIAFLSVLLGAGAEGLVAQQILSPEYSFWPFFTGYCLQMVLLSLAIADQIRLNQTSAQKKIEVLNEDLQHHIENISEIVETKTTEIRSLLDHIPQGVFSIEQGLKVSSQFSAHLPKILGTSDIAGRTVTDLILDRCTLSTDQKDILVQTINSTIGEDEISFELNFGNLPTEIAYIDANNRKKIFALTWNVELGTNRLIKRIMVTVLDVTQSKSIEIEFEKQKSEIDHIKELIDCGASKFAQFVATIAPLLEENTRLIDLGLTDEDTIKIMFVNAHTAKGAARTLGLAMLSNLIHEAEHSYVDVLKNIVPLDIQRMQTEMRNITNSLAQYIAINQNSLGRKDDFKNVQVEKKFLAEHCALMSKLDKIQKLTRDEDLDQSIRSSINQIVKIIYNSLSFILEDCLLNASRIAKDLNKPPPVIKLQAIDILISQQIESVLRKISIHLIRNALDHGIETPKERLQLGKPAAGVLTIDTICTESQLQIILSDDGRGLAIRTLRENGLKIGKLQENSSIHQVANMIFESGVSTSHAVSHFSGRGMGMDAVKRFVEEVGGTVNIQLKDATDSEGCYFSFDIILSFPLSEVFALVS